MKAIERWMHGGKDSFSKDPRKGVRGFFFFFFLFSYSCFFFLLFLCYSLIVILIY